MSRSLSRVNDAEIRLINRRNSALEVNPHYHSLLRWKCAYMYVCTYVWMCVCMYECINVFINVSMYAFMYTQLHIYVCMHLCIRMYVCVWRIHIYACMYVFMYLRFLIYHINEGWHRKLRSNSCRHFIRKSSRYHRQMKIVTANEI